MIILESDTWCQFGLKTDLQCIVIFITTKITAMNLGMGIYYKYHLTGDMKDPFKISIIKDTFS